MGREGFAERRVDVLVGVGDEAQPFVEMTAADRDVVHRRVDLQNDAADLPAEGRERLRTHVPTAQGGRNGEMLDVAVRSGVPVEQNADELFAAPDAVGFEARIAERPVVPLRVPAFAAGE